MAWTLSTANWASVPWHTVQVSIGPRVCSAAWPTASAPSWHAKQAVAEGCSQARLRHVPPTQLWPAPHGLDAEQVAPESAWHLVQLRTSIGRRISERSTRVLRKPRNVVGL